MLGNVEWGYVLMQSIRRIRPNFLHHLRIDIFSGLDFECPDGCFPKSSSLSQRDILKLVVALFISPLKDFEQHNNLLNIPRCASEVDRGKTAI